MRLAFVRLAALFFLAGLVTSCIHVEEEREPLTKTHLFITRSPIETRLTWKSEVGFSYTVMSKSKRKGSLWKPVRGASFHGTGEDITIAESPQRGVLKRYRLQVEPLQRVKK